jgi:hypothetical protein
MLSTVHRGPAQRSSMERSDRLVQARARRIHRSRTGRRVGKLEGAGSEAVLAMSPYCVPFLQKGKGNLESIGILVMCQGGIRDVGISPSLKKQAGCYPQTSSPAYFVEFEGAGHFAWTDLNPRYHEIIDRLQPCALRQTPSIPGQCEAGRARSRRLGAENQISNVRCYRCRASANMPT